MRALSLAAVCFGLILLLSLPLLVADIEHMETRECVEVFSHRVGITPIYGTVCPDTVIGFEGMPDSVFQERVQPVIESVQSQPEQ